MRVTSYTMRDVARVARVSVATVSAIVNQKGGVSPELTRQVEEAIEALDYHPNQVARSLRVNRTSTIGMVVPDLTNLFFAEVLRGVEDEARRNSLSVVLCNSNEDPEQERSLLRTLVSRRVDGILLASANSSVVEYRPSLQRSPIICFDRVPSGFKGGAVIVDNVAAAYEATRHLIQLGHQRLAIITGSLKVSTGFERLEGFRKALQEAHLPLRAEYLREGDFSFGSESGYRLGVELLHLPAPPTAVFACNNRITLGLMRAVSELGVRCPDRVSVVGFDDFDWSTLFSPKLTTVIQPCYEMGNRAVQMLLRRIQSRSTALQDGDETLVVLKAQLCVRESTAAPTAEFVSFAESP